MDQNEKSFRIGQRVRIIGPTAADTNIHTGKYFVIEEAKGVQWKNGPFQYCVGYSKHGSIHAWPASSLELAEPEYVTDGQMVEIGPVKKHNHSVTSISIDALLDRLDSIEKRLQALEGKAKEGTSAQEREDADYKLYEEMARVPDTRRDRRVQKRRFGGGIG